MNIVLVKLFYRKYNTDLSFPMNVRRAQMTDYALFIDGRNNTKPVFSDRDMFSDITYFKVRLSHHLEHALKIDKIGPE